MQYAIAVAALVAGVSATYPVANATAPVYTTEVVTAYTTYCPAPTVITHGASTYTVSSATTLTITDCPCTISKPVYSTSAPSPAPPAGSPSAPVGSAPAGSPSVPAGSVSGAPYPTGNATAPGSPSAPVGSAPSGSTPTSPAGGETPSPGSPGAGGSASPSAPIPTGAASKAFAPAGLAGLIGLAAYLL